jgi:general secretion pathway protein J
MTRGKHAAEAGFSLIEVLVAMVLLATIVSGLATVTAQWLPNWSRGFASVERSDVLTRGIERAVADLAAAEYVPLGNDAARPLFTGTAMSVTFVRPALGPNTKPGLEIVQLAELANRSGVDLVRRRARFTPQGSDADPSRLPLLGDPVVLLRAPYGVTFSYAGADRKWKDSWRDAKRLPRAVRILIRDSTTQRVLPVSTAVTLHIDDAPACQDDGKGSGCGDGKDASPVAATTAANAPAGNGASAQ